MVVVLSLNPVSDPPARVQGMAVLEYLDASPPRRLVAVDTETSGASPVSPPFCLTLCTDVSGRLETEFIDLRDLDLVARGRIGKTLFKHHLIFHGAKFDIEKLLIAEVFNWKHLESLMDKKNFSDTSILARFLLPGLNSYNLKKLAAQLWGYEPIEEEALRKERRRLKIKKSDGYEAIPREILEPYAVKDALLTLQLYSFLESKFEMDQIPEEYYRELDLALILVEVELTGVKIDMSYLKSIKEHLTSLCEKLSNSIEGVNINSSVQLLKFFADSGVNVKSVDKTSLNKIREKGGKIGEAANNILLYRKYHKYLSYVQGLEKEVGAGDLFYPSYNLSSTVTGRMSSSSQGL
jgi:DNA polymerase I-like protein with 3'-5' exonuclease and polymerase domains